MDHAYEGRVREEEAGEQLLSWLRRHLPAVGGAPVSGAVIRRALQTGKVSVEDTPTADAGRVLAAHDRVRYWPDAPRHGLPGRELLIRYRDAHLVVVDKPAGMLSIPASHGAEDPVVTTLLPRILARIEGGDPKIHVVHRLDRDTSGLMVFARTLAAQEALKAIWEAHDVTRIYLAIVAGQVHPTPWTLRGWWVADRGDGRKAILPEAQSVPDGRLAITHVRGLEAGAGMTLVEARLETGRTHQIRIHLSQAGHPVIGDAVYGRRSGERVARLGLHSHQLAFTHPITGEALSLRSPLPDDLAIFWRTRAQLLSDQKQRGVPPHGSFGASPARGKDAAPSPPGGVRSPLPTVGSVRGGAGELSPTVENVSSWGTNQGPSNKSPSKKSPPKRKKG